MQPGDADQRIELQRETRTTRPDGGADSSWAVYDTVWAKVVPITGREQDQADQQEALQSYRLTIRNRQDMTTADRVRWVDEDVLMNIRYIAAAGKRDMWLSFDAEAGVAT